MKKVVKLFIYWIDDLIKECDGSVSKRYSMAGLKNVFQFFPPQKK